MEIAAREFGKDSVEERVWLVPLTLMVAGLYVLAEFAAIMNGASTAPLVADYVGKALRATPLVISVIILYKLILMLIAREPHPTLQLLKIFKAQATQPVLIIGKIAPLLLMPVLFAAVGMLKMQIPHFVPFAHDALFAKMDAALFLGSQPWELTHKIFGGVTATAVIDRLYTFWVYLLSVAIVFFALAAPREERARFFLSFTAIWIVLGVFGAYFGSSAGPCFLHLMGSDVAPAFEGLMSNLASVDAQLAEGGAGGLGAFVWQNVLWNAHSTDTIAFSMGISAMPSLHNAIAFLYMLCAFRFGRVAGFAGLAFVVITLVGSVHLGWHYAVDGLFAFVGTYAVWLAVNAFLLRSGYGRGGPAS